MGNLIGPQKMSRIAHPKKWDVISFLFSVRAWNNANKGLNSIQLDNRITKVYAKTNTLEETEEMSL